MKNAITVSLPQEVRAELDRVSNSEGVSQSDIVRESVRDYLFIRQFRSLRKSMATKATQRGIYTDQDVFTRVS